MKQGCALAPTLFTILLSMMLQRATEDLSDEDRVYKKYRTDGSLFNLRLQAHTKTSEQLVRELFFADDATLVAHTEIAKQDVSRVANATFQRKHYPLFKGKKGR